MAKKTLNSRLGILGGISILLLVGCAVPLGRDVTPTAASQPTDERIGEQRWIDPKFPLQVCEVGPPGCRFHNSGSFVIERTMFDGPSKYYFVSLASGAKGYVTSLDIITTDSEAEHKRKLAQAAECKRRGGVSIGMSKAQVLAPCSGKPERVNTTITAGHQREQWVYGNNYVYFSNGVVTSIQTSR